MLVFPSDPAPEDSVQLEDKTSKAMLITRAKQFDRPAVEGK
jgi:hypothetical protein